MDDEDEKQEKTNESSEQEKEENEVSEESELEEKLEDTAEDFDRQEFTGFMIPASRGNFAPVLTPINTPQGVELEQTMFATPTQRRETIEEDEIRYNNFRGYNVVQEEETRRYEIAQQEMQAPVLTSVNESQRNQFLDPLAGRGFQRDNDVEPRMVETGTISRDRGLPFEKKDRKYKNVKL